MKTEMRKLNRIKYAYTDEEKQQLLKDGYVAVSKEKTDGNDEEQNPAEENSDSMLQPESQEDAEKETAEKRGTKKK